MEILLNHCIRLITANAIHASSRRCSETVGARTSFIPIIQLIGLVQRYVGQSKFFPGDLEIRHLIHISVPNELPLATILSGYLAICLKNLPGVHFGP
jgi:hypothetical protein